MSLAGLIKKGEVIKAPAENVEDFKAQIQSLKDELKAKDAELENKGKTLAEQEREFAIYKAEQEQAFDAMQAAIKRGAENVENAVKTEVHNQLASLGYLEPLPAAVEPQNVKPASDNDAKKFLAEFGINF